MTSLNTALLGAARVALALGRDGYLPSFFARIHPRLKTPLPAILVTGLITAIAATPADEVFLSYITNFGFMLLVFSTNVSVILLRRKYPERERPFRTPWYPITPILGCLGIVVVEAFTETHALVVGLMLIGAGVAVYYLRRPVGRAVEVAVQTVEAARHEILVPLANPLSAKGLLHLAVVLGRARETVTLVALSVAPVPLTTPLELAQEVLEKEEDGRKTLLREAAKYAHEQGVPIRTLLRAARSVSSGILGVAESRPGVGLILMGWRGQLSTHRVAGSVVKDVVSGARCDVAVLRDRGIADRPIQRVLVPVGGGPHARLALRLAWDITHTEGGSLTALRLLPEEEEVDMAVEMEVLRQTVEDVLGDAVQKVTCNLKRAPSVAQGILREAEEGEYDLVIIGASEEWFLHTLLFGSIPDQVAEGAPCSVLMVRKYEPAAVSWLRRVMKKTPQGRERRGEAL